MLKVLWSTLTELVDSKKAMVLLGTMIAWVAARRGWNVDQASIDRALALVGTWLAGQSAVDFAKSKAANDNAPVPVLAQDTTKAA